MPNALISEVQRGSSSVLDAAPYYKMQGGQTGGPFTPGTLAAVNSSGQVTVAVANDKTVIGAFRLGHLPGAITTGAAYSQIGYDRCACIADSAITAGQRLKAAQLGRVAAAVDSVLAGTVIATGAGVTFTNQPTGDQFEILSSSAADAAGKTVTIYFTKTGTTTTVSSETLTLNGTTAVASVTTTVQNVLAVTKNIATTGTITIRKKTGAATITTLAPATLSSGLLTVSAGAAYNAIPALTVDAADTAIVGILGTGTGDAALSSVIAATGTTAANFGAVPFKTVTLAMVGAATTARTYTVAVSAADSMDLRIGRALESATAQGQLIDCFLTPNR